ncbi:hypothetical protein COOONC_01067 [Cooperia oncophora]
MADASKYQSDAGNSVSKEFVQTLYSHEFAQLVHTPTRGSSILDLVFCNRHFLVSGVNVLPPIGTSDHATVQFLLNIYKPDPQVAWLGTSPELDWRAVGDYLGGVDWIVSSGVQIPSRVFRSYDYSLRLLESLDKALAKYYASVENKIIASKFTIVWFHGEEIYEVLSAWPTSPSITPDFIPFKFIKMVLNHLLYPLEHLFNLSYLRAEVPDRWKHSLVTPVPKKAPTIAIKLSVIFAMSGPLVDLRVRSDRTAALEALRNLWSYPHFETLHLEGCQLTDQDIENIHADNSCIKYVCLRNNLLAHPWLALKAKLPAVTYLDLRENRCLFQGLRPSPYYYRIIGYCLFRWLFLNAQEMKGSHFPHVEQLFLSRPLSQYASLSCCCCLQVVRKRNPFSSEVKMQSRKSSQRSPRSTTLPITPLSFHFR